MFKDEVYETHSTTWSDVFKLVKKYWQLVLIVFAAGTIGTYLTLQLFFTSQYETKASLLVKVGRENTEIPATVLNGQVLNQGVRLADINSEVQILSSRVLVEKVVDEMGPDRFKFELKPPASVFGYPKYVVKRVARWVKAGYKEFLILASIKKRLTPREQAILGVEDGVTVEPVKESDVLLLKVRMPDPSLCVEVANRLLTHYLEQRSQARQVQAGRGFFASQVEENRAQLKGALEQRAKLRQDFKLSSADQERNLLLQELTSVRLQMMQNQGEIAQLEKQQSVMTSQLVKQPEMLPKERVEARNPALQSIKDRLTSLQVDRAKFASRYQPDSETLKHADSEIADLQAALNRESVSVSSSTTSEINPVVKDFKSSLEQNTVRIAGLTSRNSDLAKTEAQITADLARVNKGSDAYETVDRDYRLAEQNYLEYSKKNEEARISEALNSMRLTNVALVAPPETPIEPVYPRQLFILAFALPISLLLGVAFAALCESMDDRINNADSLESLAGVGFLGTWEVEETVTGGVHGD